MPDRGEDQLVQYPIKLILRYVPYAPPFARTTRCTQRNYHRPVQRAAPPSHNPLFKMEALQKDILDSESDDSDYEPPAKANSSSAALSINKKRVREGGLPLDDDDDDDDSDDEFDDDDFSDEADQVEAEARIGASSSSAGAAAASASADASVTAKPPASVPQHGSEGKAVIRDSQLPNVPAASSGSAAGATEADKSDGDSQPTKKRKTNEEDEVAGKSSAENKVC